MALQRRELLALAGVALAAAGAGFAVGPWLSRGAPGDTRALAAARFSDPLGGKRSLAEWRGKVLVLNFWATWCAPCREEIPMLVAARERYARSGVEILGIAIDTAAKVTEYVAQMKIPYPILLAGADGLELMRNLGNQASGLPFTVLVDRAGQPAARKLGALRREDLDSMLAGLLAHRPAQGVGGSSDVVAKSG